MFEGKKKSSISVAVKSRKDWGEGEIADSYVSARGTVEGDKKEDGEKKQREQGKREETKDSKEERREERGNVKF